MSGFSITRRQHSLLTTYHGRAELRATPIHRLHHNPQGGYCGHPGFAPPQYRIVRAQRGLPGGSMGEEPAWQCRRCRQMQVRSPGQEESPGGGHGNSLQYSCLENPHGQRSLAGYSP